MLRRISLVFKVKLTTAGLISILLFYHARALYAELPLIPITENSWEEEYDESRPVSAYIFMGAIIGNAKRRVDPDLLLVHLPATSSSNLCVEIMSQDARYYARSKYSISGRPTGTYRIELPSRIPGKLKNYIASEVSVLAELKDNCNHSEMTGFVPVSWGTPHNLNQINIQLSVSGADSKLIIPDSNEGGKRTIVKCRLIESSIKNTSFDTLCTFAIADLNSLCKTSLRRQHFGDWLKAEQLRIFCAK